MASQIERDDDINRLSVFDCHPDTPNDWCGLVELSPGVVQVSACQQAGYEYAAIYVDDNGAKALRDWLTDYLQRRGIA